VTPNLCGESYAVGRPGDESAVAGERLLHDSLANEARNGRLESGKATPTPRQSDREVTLGDAPSEAQRTQSWSRIALPTHWLNT
jgi:hypothetical protein